MILLLMLFSASSELFLEGGLWFIEFIDDDDDDDDDDEFFLLHDDNEFLDEFLDSNEHNEFLEEWLLPLPPPNDDFNEPNDSLGLIKQSCKLRSTNIPLTPEGKKRNNPNGCEYNSK